ncbi:MAG TPA: hypothetical protein VGK20_19490 [Candidatus Binatia bacterium]|jgi:hypothetical protein
MTTGREKGAADGRSATTTASSAASGTTLLAAIGFGVGVLGLLALLVVASLTPVAAHASLSASAPGLDVLVSDTVLRCAAVVIFLSVAGVLFLSSARQWSVLAQRENAAQPRQR